MNDFAAQDPVHVAAGLLDTVADHSVDHALTDIEGLVAKLKRDAEEAAAARDTLRRTPAEILRDAMRLRATRVDGPC